MVQSIAKIQDTVKDILLDFLKIDEQKVKLDSEFLNDFGCDSLDSIELMVEVEESFGVKINDDEASNIVTVSDLINYIDLRLQI
ncbi:MAG: acyl carrier protein [Oscillospiraceae bacterium]|nr:acyl carrier protein [Oscillospiraceae bacterium]